MAEIWNGLLSGLGAMLSFFYNLIPSYGVAIILLTIAVRIVLLPLGIKQTRSMQAMQKIQPKIKELQRKYKGNKQKLNEELMKLYKEHQVNPLGGCLPLLLQLPVFFALYRVLLGSAEGVFPGTRYLPAGSQLAVDIKAGAANFLGVNLACSPRSVGGGFLSLGPGIPQINCGTGVVVRILPYLLVALMVFSTYWQQRQMQRASAAGGQQRQMQLMGRIMPVFLGFISLQIATGVLVYWVTTNGWQIGQQTLMLRSRPQPTPAGDGKAPSEQRKGDTAPPAKAPRAKKEERPPQRPRNRNARGRKKRSKR